ncbi:hypothetical protein CVT26_012775 [Gymnopilus dilepis]|uniref:Uncharacterized protein n=1 Tax=Gymnopilus dilepis TaxID=231916 RepID=A0A409Y400_9AGAR|nr:hypothetical protein CVT26_012775 [Gymnopilus dilepis]
MAKFKGLDANMMSSFWLNMQLVLPLDETPRLAPLNNPSSGRPKAFTRESAVPSFMNDIQ